MTYKCIVKNVEFIQSLDNNRMMKTLKPCFFCFCVTIYSRYFSALKYLKINFNQMHFRKIKASQQINLVDISDTVVNVH